MASFKEQANKPYLRQEIRSQEFAHALEYLDEKLLRLGLVSHRHIDDDGNLVVTIDNKPDIEGTLRQPYAILFDISGAPPAELDVTGSVIESLTSHQLMGVIAHLGTWLEIVDRVAYKQKPMSKQEVNITYIHAYSAARQIVEARNARRE